MQSLNNEFFNENLSIIKALNYYKSIESYI